jgi:hypothetical protein
VRATSEEPFSCPAPHEECLLYEQVAPLDRKQPDSFYVGSQARSATTDTLDLFAGDRHPACSKAKQRSVDGSLHIIGRDDISAAMYRQIRLKSCFARGVKK